MKNPSKRYFLLFCFVATALIPKVTSNSSSSNGPVTMSANQNSSSVTDAGLSNTATIGTTSSMAIMSAVVATSSMGAMSNSHSLQPSSVPATVSSSVVQASVAPSSVLPSSQAYATISSFVISASSMGSASSVQVGNSAGSSIQPAQSTVGSEITSSVPNGGGNSNAAVSPSVSPSEIISSLQSKMHTAASSITAAQTSAIDAQSETSDFRGQSTAATSNAIPKASTAVGQLTTSILSHSSQAVGQITNSPATTAQTPVTMSHAPTATSAQAPVTSSQAPAPTSSQAPPITSPTASSGRLSCYTCQYNNSGYCIKNEKTCESGAIHCYDFHITYKNGSGSFGKSCDNDGEICKNTDKTCDNRNKTGQIKACSFECCRTSSKCNDNFGDNKASQLGFQFAFCLALIAFGCLFA